MDELKKIRPVICCLGYNRPDSMKRLLDSIGRAIVPYNDITLIISIDKSDKSKEVEQVARDFYWAYGEKIIKTFSERQGVIKHTLQCGDLSYKFEAVIYLEDDIVVSPGFYIYTVEALDFYKDDKSIFGIALYSQRWLSSPRTIFEPSYNGSDVYMFNGDVSWGQCWIKGQWIEFKKWFKRMNNNLPSKESRLPKTVLLYGERSWSKYIAYYMVEKKLFYAVPYYSYTTCFSEIGMHTSRSSDAIQVPISWKTDMDFHFFRSDFCIKYDSFFERIDAFVKDIKGVSFDKVCIDFNGLKYEWTEYSYILTIKKLPFKKISEFGVNYEPIEMNIIFNNYGKGIFLYKIDHSFKFDYNCKKICNERLYHYLERYRIRNLIEVIRKKLRKNNCHE